MGNNILADTSILISLQREDEEIADVWEKYKEQILVSRVTTCELIFGARDKKEKELNKKLFRDLEITEINEAVSSHAYTLIDKYGMTTKLSIADALIASTSIVTKSLLWTLNKKHFVEIKGLKFF